MCVCVCERERERERELLRRSQVFPILSFTPNQNKYCIKQLICFAPNCGTSTVVGGGPAIRARCTLSPTSEFFTSCLALTEGSSASCPLPGVIRSALIPCTSRLESHSLWPVLSVEVETNAIF